MAPPPSHPQPPSVPSLLFIHHLAPLGVAVPGGVSIQSEGNGGWNRGAMGQIGHDVWHSVCECVDSTCAQAR